MMGIIIRNGWSYSLVSFLFMSCYCPLAAATDTMTPGQSLRKWKQLISKGDNFALRIFSYGESSNYYVGIWYNKLSTDTETLVWVANRDNPLPDDAGIFALLKDGNLAVVDGSNETIWQTNISTEDASSLVAVLLDSGNLVLKNGERIVWQSFDYPFDTLLPGMKIPRRRTNSLLTSRKKSDDLGYGTFSFGVDPWQQQNQLFIWRSNWMILYWESGIWNGHFFEWIPKVNEQFLFHFTRSNDSRVEEMYFTYSSSYEYTRMVLDESGQLQFWIWYESGEEWKLVWFSDGCDATKCGANGFCVNKNVYGYGCRCLPGFEAVSNSGNWSDGCRRKTALGCESKSGIGDGFVALSEVDGSYTSSVLIARDSQLECKAACVANCNCSAYAYIGSGRIGSYSKCQIWKGDLIGLHADVNDSQHHFYLRLATSEISNWCVEGACGVNANCNNLYSSVCQCSPRFEPVSPIKWKSRNWGEGCRRNAQMQCTTREGDCPPPTPKWSAHCPSCGKITIPYPLSTEEECGEIAYKSFICDNSTGELHFKSFNDNYNIISINPQAQTFVIKLDAPSNCSQPSHYINLNHGQQFYITNTTTILLLNCTTPPVSTMPLNCNSSSPCYRYIHEGMTSCNYSSKCCSYIPGVLPSPMYSVDVLKTGCNTYTSIVNVNQSPTSSWQVGVEIGWGTQQEPECDSMEDCMFWPNTECKSDYESTAERKRCSCNVNFKWDRSTKKCIVLGEFKKKRSLLIVTLVPVVLGTAFLGTCIYWCWRIRIMKKGKKEKMLNISLSLLDARDLLEISKFEEHRKKGLDIPFVHFDAMVAATENFSDSNKLGQGGFGPVYKGNLPGGQEIAVKKLSKTSGQGLEEFRNEVILIAKLQHRNLVRLLGYCIEGDEKMLIYEYLPNKSLDSFIFDRSRCKLLDWEKRFVIILGIARGLHYLHEDSRLRIIHRDLKASNILLDDEMNPKISDFGLARIFGGNQTEANTERVVGTYGYMSPEYALDGIFSAKSDVFSFGVVLLEIISGKKNTGFYNYENSLSLLGHAWQLWKEGKGIDLVDMSAKEKCSESEVLKSICIGLLCVQEDAIDRPTMASVLAMLVTEAPALPTPKQPAFVLRTLTSSSIWSKTCCQNEITIPTIGGR